MAGLNRPNVGDQIKASDIDPLYDLLTSGASGQVLTAQGSGAAAVMESLTTLLPDATTTSVGVGVLDQNPPAAQHPVLVTEQARHADNGVGEVGTDGMLSTMYSPLLGAATGVVPEAGRWVVSASNPLFGGVGAAATQEPNVLVEGGILKMWYTGDLTGIAGNCYLALRTCTGDPTVPGNWSAPTTVLGGGASGYSGVLEHTGLVKLDGVYYVYFADGNNGNLLRSTSTDGVAWTTPVQVIAAGQVGWSTGWNNSYVWKEGATWWMLVEGSTGGTFVLTLAMSTDGVAWTFPTGGFLTSLRPGGTGDSSGPWMMYPQKRNGLYHLWYHGGTSTLPSDIYHATATSLTGTWTITNAGNPIIVHDSGGGYDQAADPCVVEFNGQTYLFHERVHNSANRFEMMVVSVPITIAQLIDGARQLDGVADGFATLDSGGHVSLSELAGITHSQLDAAAGLTAGQITAVNPSALTGSGTVPVAALPVATSSTQGIAQPDNTTITVTGGVLTAATAATSGQLLVEDGVTAPPVNLYTEDGTDWLYSG